MKQIGRKLTLVLLAFLSVILMVFGVATVGPMTSVNASGASAETTVEEGSFFKIEYSKDEFTVLLSSGYRDYLEVNRGDAQILVDAVASAAREILFQSLLSQIPDDDEPAKTSVRSRAWTPDQFDPDSIREFDWSDVKKYKNYVTELMSDPDNFAAFVAGDYDLVLDYAIGVYMSGRDFSKEDEIEVYNKVADAIQAVLRDAIQNMAGERFDELYAAGEFDGKFAGLEGEALEAAVAKYKAEICAWNEGDVDANGWLYNEVREDCKGDMAIGKITELLNTVRENGHTKSPVNLADLFKAFKGLTLDHTHVLYNAKNGIDPSGLRYILSLIPRPAEIAAMDNLEDLISTWVEVETTYGVIDFQFTFGFYGAASDLKKAAAYLADHFEFTLDGNDAALSVDAPAIFTKVYSKFLESSRFTDNQKNMVFSVFSKTSDEILDKAESYELEDVLNFLKRPDYQKWFANALNADMFNEYFGVYFTKVTGYTLTQEQVYSLVQRLYNRVLPYIDRVENLTADSLESWLQENVPGFDSFTDKGHDLAEKLLDIVKRVDWKKFDSDYVRELVEDPSSKNINEHIYHWIDRLAGSKLVNEYYEKFLGYVEALYNVAVPDRLKDGTILDLYDGEKFVYSGSFTLDLEKVFKKVESVLENHGLSPFAEIVDALSAMIERTKYTLDLHLELNVPNLYEVEYVVGDETVRAGFLPAGTSAATIETLSRVTSIEGFDVIGWYSEVVDGKAVAIKKMPAENVKLYPITDFTLTAEVEGYGLKLDRAYNGLEDALTVTAYGVSYAQYTYKWYKDGVAFAEGETLNVCEVADSGIYYAEVTDLATGITHTTEEFEYVLDVNITKALVEVNPEWDYEGPYTYNAETYTVALKEGWTADESLLKPLVYTGNEGTDVNEYLASVTFTLLDNENYLLVVNGEEVEEGTYTDSLAWSIEQALIELGELEYFADGYWWPYEEAFTYSGELYTVRVEATGFGAELVKIEGTFEAKNANTDGPYTVTATLTDTANFKIGRYVDGKFVELEAVTAFEWLINPKLITFGDLMVDDVTKYELPLEYQADGYALTLKYSESENGVLVFTGLEGKAVGTYTVKATFAEGVLATNYYFAEGVDLNELATWEIVKATVYVELGYVTYAKDEYVYSGELFDINFKYDGANADILKVSFTGTTQATNAGTYAFTVTFALTEEAAKCYDLAFKPSTADAKIVDGNVVADYEWTIHKAKVDVEIPEWVLEKTVYDWNEGKPVRPTNAAYEDKEIQKFFVVTYTYDPDENGSAGNYTAWATFTLREELRANYYIESENEEVFSFDSNEVTYEIYPEDVLDLAGVTWLVNGEADWTEFTYGDKVEITLDFTNSNVSEEEQDIVSGWITVTDEFGNPATIRNVGKYYVTLTLPTDYGKRIVNSESLMNELVIIVNKKAVEAVVTIDEDELKQYADTDKTPIFFHVIVSYPDSEIEPITIEYSFTGYGFHTVYGSVVDLPEGLGYEANYYLKERVDYEYTVEVLRPDEINLEGLAWLVNGALTTSGELTYEYNKDGVDVSLNLAWIGKTDLDLQKAILAGITITNDKGETVAKITDVGTYKVSFKAPADYLGTPIVAPKLAELTITVTTVTVRFNVTIVPPTAPAVNGSVTFQVVLESDHLDLLTFTLDGQFIVVGENGKFTVTNLPEGKYTVNVFVSLTDKSGNYLLENGKTETTYEAEYWITASSIDLSALTWKLNNNTVEGMLLEYTYSEEAYAVSLDFGGNETLLKYADQINSWIKVNGKPLGEITIKDAGTYTITLAYETKIGVLDVIGVPAGFTVKINPVEIIVEKIAIEPSTGEVEVRGEKAHFEVVVTLENPAHASFIDVDPAAFDASESGVKTVTVSLKAAYDNSNYVLRGITQQDIPYYVVMVGEELFDLSGISLLFNGAALSNPYTYNGAAVTISVNWGAAQFSEEEQNAIRGWIRIDGKPLGEAYILNAGTYNVTFELPESYQGKKVVGAPSYVVIVDPITITVTNVAVDPASITETGEPIQFTVIIESAYDYMLDWTPKGDVQTVPGTYKIDIAISLKAEYAATGNYVLAEESKLFENISYTIEKLPELNLQNVTWLVNGVKPIGADLPFTYNGKAITVALDWSNSGLTAEEIADVESWIRINGKPLGEVVILNAGTYTVELKLPESGLYNRREIVGYNELKNLTITVAGMGISVTSVELDKTEAVETGEGITFNVIVKSDYLDLLDWDHKSFTETDPGTYNVTVTVTLKDTSGNYVLTGKTSFELTFTITEKPIIGPQEGREWELESGKLKDVDNTVSEDLDATASKEELTDEQKKDIEKAVDEAFEEDYDVKFGTAYDIHFEDEEGTETPVNGKFLVSLLIPENLRSYKDDRLAVIHIHDDGTVEIVPNTTRNGNYMEFEVENFSIYLVIGLDDAEVTPVTPTNWLIPILILIALLLLIALLILIIFAAKLSKSEEEPAEEPVAEAVVEPAPAAVEEVEEIEEAEEPAVVAVPVVEEAPAEETAEEIIVAVEPEEVVLMTIYDRSFTARLTQSDEPTRSYYSELKNYILSYKYVRSRISWNYDAFTKGGEKIAKLQFKGKSLFLYLALDPEELEARFHHRSVADVAKYEDVPTKLKVRSARSLKYAKALIDLVMARLGGEQDVIPTEDYRLAYKSTALLIEEGEIKVKKVPAPEFWNMDAADIIDNSPELPEVEDEDLEIPEDVLAEAEKEVAAEMADQKPIDDEE